MPEPLDLSQLFGDAPLPDNLTDGVLPVDLSGKPKPKGVRVQLNSGVVVKCDVRYQGTAPNSRVYAVIAEIDWENYHPVILMVEEMPSDIEFRCRIPGLSDEEANVIAAGITLQPERIIGV